MTRSVGDVIDDWHGLKAGDQFVYSTWSRNEQARYHYTFLSYREGDPINDYRNMVVLYVGSECVFPLTSFSNGDNAAWIFSKLGGPPAKRGFGKFVTENRL